MTTFFLVRLLTALLTIFGVALAVFLLLHLIPGDPVEIMLGDMAPAADREALRHALHLDLPITTQIQEYFSGLLRLDMGKSLFEHKPVAVLLAERIPATLELASAGLILAIILAVPLGVFAAKYKDKALDTTAMGFSLLGASIPSFWLGPILIMVFSLWLGWTPVGGHNDGVYSLILPALTLGTSLTAILARMIRSSLLEVMSEDFIRTARAKGLRENVVLIKHGLSNALLPVLTLLGLQLGGLLGGAVITETVFDWPGLGSLLVLSIQRRDIPVAQGLNVTVKIQLKLHQKLSVTQLVI
ncbi:glutathione ABC transporter permease [Achromatium sp. WMS2]|nr:glutathione ABC transporter permease [Achromatium sp. WMS2]